MNQNPDQLSQLLLEADGLLLLLHRHRDETPIDAIKILRKKLELILALTDGLDELETTDVPPVDNHADDSVGEYIEDTIEDPIVSDVLEAPEIPLVEDTPIVVETPSTFHHTYTVSDPTVDTPASTSPRRHVSSTFNLNDKFRFRRELFGNSDAQYVECLDMLSAMTNIDEAKEYLFDDLRWDPNNDDVKDFIELLTNFYK